MGTVLAVLVFLVLAALFEVAETAVLAVGEVRLQTLLKKGDPRAAVLARIRQNIRLTLGTLLLGQTICDIGAASLAAVAATDVFGVSVGIEATAMTVVVLIFVNLIPKTLAANNAERLSLALARPLFYLMVVFGPITVVIDKFVGIFVRAKGPGMKITEEEIKTMTSMGVKAGAVEKGERELIERVFLFNDITADDVLTPKEIMVVLDGSKPVTDAFPLINSSRFSRYPVYSGSPENIIGIVHIKELLVKLTENPPSILENTPLREFASPPVFVPASEPIDDLFRQFQKGRIHMALVLNDAGSLVGLLTFEDLLEELVGEISDESDVDEHLIKRIDKYTVLVHGDTELPDVNRFFNVRLDAGEQRTLGRLIRSRIGRTPRQGQVVQLADNLIASVEQISRGRMLKVKLVKVPEPPAPRS